LRILHIVRFLVGVLCVTAASGASAEVAFHFAYRAVRPDAVPASFPNNPFFQFMSKAPFIVGKDLLRATPGYADGTSYVEVAITEDAMKRISELAASNTRLYELGWMIRRLGWRSS
jgi:hypothetical protein